MSRHDWPEVAIFSSKLDEKLGPLLGRLASLETKIDRLLANQAGGNVSAAGTIDPAQTVETDEISDTAAIYERRKVSG